VFYLVLAAGVVVATVLLRPPDWYLPLALLMFLGAVMVVSRTRRDRGFYLVCGGEPLVVACGIMNLWTGLFAVWMLAGIVGGSTGLIRSGHDLRAFALFCAGSGAIALIVFVSNHVLQSVLVLAGITAMILGVLSVRSYQFRKHCSGA
jgi:hypothetical protein